MKYSRIILCIISSVLMTCLLSSCSLPSESGTMQPVPVNLSEPQQREREKMQKDIFVSPNGEDSNSGTQQEPIKTVERALELAEKIDKKEKVIFFERGEYHVSSLKLTKKK